MGFELGGFGKSCSFSVVFGIVYFGIGTAWIGEEEVEI